MKVVIPMAGLGSRFAEKSYVFPKPLCDVNGKPMIQRVVENLGFTDAQHIFLVQEEHRQQYSIDDMLQTISPGCEVIGVDGLTEGAACTVLLARQAIDSRDELLIANSDQLVDFSHENFDTMRHFTLANAIVFTFRATHPKWSFVRLDIDGCITEVAEKRVISDVATCGVYWFRHGQDFVQAADQMIAKDIRTRGEFYLAPAINEMLDTPRGYNPDTVLPFFVDAMHGIGTPEDLEAYLTLQCR